jgi:hypothetical protein
MNERIKELVKQAWAQRELVSKTKPLDDAFTEKLAELIVGECADLFKNVLISIETEHGHQSVMASKFIKDHFGIE